MYTVTLGYFFGVIQKNIVSCVSDNEVNTKISEPNHLIEAIKNSKNYKKMIEEQEKSKNESKKIIRSHISITNKKIQIEGGLAIPEFEQVENNSKNDSSVKYMSNRNNNEINNIQNNENNSNKSNKNEINNSQNNDKKSNKNIILIQKNESLVSTSKKNSKEDNNIIINNINDFRKNSQNNNINTNLYKLKNSPETVDKSEDRIYESERKQRKKSSFISDKDVDAKDKLKNLKIEINTKKLEEQIKQLFLEKKH